MTTPPNRLSSLLPTLIALVALAVAVAGFLLIRDMRTEMRDIAGKLEAAPPQRPVADRTAPAPQRLDARQPLTPPSASRRGLSLEEDLGEVSPEEVRRRAEEWVAATRAEFAAEPVDASWSAENEMALVDASVHEDLADTVSRMESFEAECRSRRCLVETRFADRGSAMDWLGIYLLNAEPLEQATHQMMMNPDGTVTIVLIGGK